MTTEIKAELRRLEQKHDIKILYAVESGSRAWGFASTDSDWDVRYLYIHRQDWYLSIDEKRDNQDEILPNDIDLAGWELKKALRLFRKSNPPMLEWLHSPIVYAEPYDTAGRLRTLMAEYFSPKSCLHHYLNMARRNFEAYLLKDLVRTKKYFYVLRPVLACDWIMQHNTMAPVEFRTLVDAQVKDVEVKAAIEALLIRKIAGDELREEPLIPVLHRFLEDKLTYYFDSLKGVDKANPPATGKLDELFRETLAAVW